jgi:superfamily II DNA or RNA helicase
VDVSLPAVSLSPGSVVRFRDRLWRLDAVQDGLFTATPLDGRDLYPRRFAAGVERIEDGSLPFPDPGHTTDPTQQDLLRRAYQLSLVHGSAPIVGLQRSRAIPTPFQIVPLLMALDRERVRLLIADDVGVGKTVEAGLILAELLARGRARRVLIVTPWNLCEQWREALSHFFHLEGAIIASHLMPALERRLLPGQSAWEANDICIASVDYLKIHGPAVLQYPWDIAIVDEAHLCARPHAAPGQIARDMLRYEFASDLAERVQHLLLLTATPHSGHTDSYASLLALLEPALVNHTHGEYGIRREAAKRHVCQRRRKDIEGWYGGGTAWPFPTRDQQEVVITPSVAQMRLLDQLREYTDELDDRAEHSPLNGWVAAHIQKRALSSPHALRGTLRRRIARVRAHVAQEESRSELVEAEIEVTDDLGGEGLSDEQRSERVDSSSSTLEPNTELLYLEMAAELAARVKPAQDPKLKELRRLVPVRANAHPAGRRVIVFTRYKDTLDYLAKQLKLDGFALFTIYGELSAAQRREIFAAFAHAEPAVLIATDCISEGLNLQHAAAEIIHYELPWNPNRLEQRNGRVDRFGQRERVVGVRTLVLDDELDMAILDSCVRKAEAIREEFGFSPPFFGGGATIRALLRRYGRRRQLSFFDHDLPGDEFFDREQLKRVQVESFFGQTDISLGEVDQVLQRSRAVTGSPERLRQFAERALRVCGCELKAKGGGFFAVDGSHPDLADVLPSDGTSLVFDPAVAAAEPDVDVLDLAHPLLRRLVDLVRDRALGPEANGRVTGWTTRAVTEVIGVVHLLARYVASSTPPVVLEELVALACPVFSEGNVDADADALLEADPAPDPARRAVDVVEAARELLERADLTERIDARLESLRAQLIARHRTLKGGWAAGLEHVDLASHDPIALTILFPVPAG